MTREEAIEIIKNYDVYSCGYCHQGGDEVKEAFDMAIKALEQEPCEDAISRQAVLDQTYNWSKDEFLRVTNPFDYLRKKINDLPSATPKTGHWILYRDHKNMVDYPQCDNCSVIIKLPLPMDNLNYCPNCGVKMVEPQESEDKNKK